MDVKRLLPIVLLLSGTARAGPPAPRLAISRQGQLTFQHESAHGVESLRHHRRARGIALDCTAVHINGLAFQRFIPRPIRHQRDLGS